RAASYAQESKGGNTAPDAGRVPAKDGVGLAPVKAPPQRGRQLQPCHPGRGERWGCMPAQDRTGPVELGLHLRAEMEGEPDVVAVAGNLIDDVDAARRPVQKHPPAKQRRRARRSVAIMLGGPAGDVAVVEYLDLMRPHMTPPHERAAAAGVAAAAEFGCVVR